MIDLDADRLPICQAHVGMLTCQSLIRCQHEQCRNHVSRIWVVLGAILSPFLSGISGLSDLGLI
jgi:hypothetical protein